MTEPLSLPEQIQHSATVDELDSPAPDDAHVPERGFPLAEDDLPSREELDLDTCGKLLERALVQLGERLVPLQELGDVVHCFSRVRPRQPRRSPVAAPGALGVIVTTDGCL